MLYIRYFILLLLFLDHKETNVSYEDIIFCQDHKFPESSNYLLKKGFKIISKESINDSYDAFAFAQKDNSRYPYYHIIVSPKADNKVMMVTVQVNKKNYDSLKKTIKALGYIKKPGKDTLEEKNLQVEENYVKKRSYMVLKIHQDSSGIYHSISCYN